MAHFIQDEEDIIVGDRFQNDRYTVLRKMTSGGQGSVMLVRDNQTKNEYILYQQIADI
jgi:hypothetical protein